MADQKKPPKDDQKQPNETEKLTTGELEDRPWAISPGKRAEWNDTYDQLPKEGDKVSGQNARAVLDKSGLDVSMLAKIWGLSDFDQDGFLSRTEFIIAMYLIDFAKEGKELPSSLPRLLLKEAADDDEPQEQPLLSDHDDEPSSEWTINPEQRSEWEDLYNKLPKENGKVSGQEARIVLDRSGLSIEVLTKIWSLSDYDQDGFLSLTEFTIAMFFIDYAKSGNKLPPSLPQELITVPRLSWIINPENREEWDAIFDNMSQGSNKLSGQQVRNVLDQSGLDIEILTQIWGLSDYDQDGFMTRAEFRIAMFFLDYAKDGKELPPSLPQELLAEALKGIKTSEMKSDKPSINDGKPLEDWSNEELNYWCSIQPDEELITPLFANLCGKDFSTLKKEDVFEVLQLGGVSREKSREIYGNLIDFNDVDIPPGQQFCFSIKGSKITGTVVSKNDALDFPYTVKVVDKMHQMKLKAGSMRVLDTFHNDLPFEYLPIKNPNEGKKLLEDWTADEIDVWYSNHKYSSALKVIFSGMDGKKVAMVEKEELIEKLTQNLSQLVALSIYWEIHGLKRYVAPPYEENYFPGVRAKTVQKIIANKSEDSFMQALKTKDKLEQILKSAGDGQIKNRTWEQMEKALFASMRNQLKASSKFEFSGIVHRFPDIYPFEFNAMPMFIGSWMGDCFGMMQWPMPGDAYLRVLRDIINHNDVGMIVALGIQNAHERMEMINYWDDLGTDKPKDEIVTKVHTRHVKGIPPNNKELWSYHFKDWPDYGSPLDDTTPFDLLFAKVREMEEANKIILIHCRAGVGRSGTFRLMYKAWKGEFGVSDLAEQVNRQRALRMCAVQSRAQFNFLLKYIKKIEQGREKSTSTATTTTTTELLEES